MIVWGGLDVRGLTVKGWLMDTAGLMGWRCSAAVLWQSQNLGGTVLCPSAPMTERPWTYLASRLVRGSYFCCLSYLHEIKDLTYLGPSQPVHPGDGEPAKPWKLLLHFPRQGTTRFSGGCFSSCYVPVPDY